MTEAYLDVVDENDNVIGRELRSVVHKNGLRHREIGVWFITPQGEVIFQIRGPNLPHNPNKPTMTVGGHVDSGMTYHEAAIMEVREESGIEIQESELHFMHRMESDKISESSGHRNFNWREFFAYVYHGKIEDLKVEEEKGAGFFSYSIQDLLHPSEEIKQRLGKMVTADYYVQMLHQMRDLIS